MALLLWLRESDDGPDRSSGRDLLDTNLNPVTRQRMPSLEMNHEISLASATEPSATVEHVLATLDNDLG